MARASGKSRAAALFLRNRRRSNVLQKRTSTINLGKPPPR